MPPNFIPSFRDLNGIRFDKFVPRFTFSGPLMRDRAWFYDGLETEYDNIYIAELPANADTDELIRGSNLQVQANLTPPNPHRRPAFQRLSFALRRHLVADAATEHHQARHHRLAALCARPVELWRRRAFDAGVGVVRFRDGYEPHGAVPTRSLRRLPSGQLFRGSDRALAAGGGNRGAVSASAPLGRKPRSEGRHRCGPYRLQRRRHRARR